MKMFLPQIVSKIRKSSTKFLRLFTIQAMLNFICHAYFYKDPFRFRKSLIIFYAVMFYFSTFILESCYVFFCMFFERFCYSDYKSMVLLNHVLNYNKYILLSSTLMILFIVVVSFNIFFYILKHFQVDFLSITEAYQFMADNGLTVVSGWKSRKKNVISSLSRFRFKTNPHLLLSEKFVFMKFLKLLEVPSFLFSFSGFLSAIFLYIFVCVYFWSYVSDYSFFNKVYHLNGFIMMYLAGFNVMSVFIPTLLYNLHCNSFSTLRMSGKLKSLKITKKASLKTFKTIKIIEDCRRVFVFIHRKFDEFNQRIASRTFNYSVIFIIGPSNVIFFLSLFVPSVLPTVEIWLAVIACLQILVLSVAFEIFIFFSRRYNNYSQMIAKSIIFLSGRGYAKFGTVSKLNLYVEFMLPKNRFYFKLGSIGKIKSYTLLAFAGVYSSTLMWFIQIRLISTG